MTKKRFPTISEVCHWRKYRHSDEVFDLSHLDAQTVEYENSNPGPPAQYVFYVTYSSHCFTTSRPDEHSLGDYPYLKNTRPFCRNRYKYSSYLPEIVAGLANAGSHCYFAGHNRFATIKLTLEGGGTIDYRMVFKAFREKKKLRLHIVSAYPLDEPQRCKKINFLAIAYNTLWRKEIKEPK